MDLVAPVPWPEMLRARRLSIQPQKQPFPVRWPVFWFAPRLGFATHGRSLFYSCWPAIRAAAREHHPDVLLATWLYPLGQAALMAARRLNLPLVIKVHGSDLLVHKNKPIILPILRQVLSEAAAVIAVSPNLAQAAQEQGAQPDKIFLVPNGVDQELFAPQDQQTARERLGLSPDGPLALFVGRLVPGKGLEMCLGALAALPQARLLVVGDGPLRPALMAQAERLDLGDRVIWAGPQPHGDIPNYLAAADVLVLPSMSEGEPNVILEALSCGRPVVASLVGNIAGMVEHGREGLLFPAGNQELFVKYLAEALERPWDPQTLRQSVAGRSWAGGARQILQVLAVAGGKKLST
ncbi:MAG: glycosyltransferase [Desulfarculaceae bacterium]|nr:glycosyltransferase [Desulfarculaceae bacterium]MCF8045992.1 glycosyltransferase [Desulfarculaceae bacterium]MCF8066403.1 glycosyltransferase [Desulfarculaceae bacterium]MCF8097655.1 glycosyltransferase [Desulfarculaceae bacterium]MCF8122470.1 glycosyltransferase [Desulfarculaceae bacterium]